MEFDFKISPVQPGSDILLAELSILGFESFVEKEDGLLAYTSKNGFDQNGFDETFILNSPEFEISWSKREIEQQNWNENWEKNFNPITIENILSVRAPFHPLQNTEYDIVIVPKMSFGTGHHETTSMMLHHILQNDFDSKTVLDMGCGTGVLAVLSEMKGASQVDAIDIDAWSFENAIENVERNQCKNIKVFQGNANLLRNRKYDIILANINRNILMEDLPTYANCLNNGGWLFMSGFYGSDFDVISSKCESLGLSLEKKMQKGDWVSVKYVF